MANLFDSIRVKVPKTNKFNESHDRKFSMKFGKLTPCMCVPILPGDRVKIRSEALIRFAPMIAPVMHRVQMFVHFFFVPNRIIWDNWEKFITGGREGNISTSDLPLYPRLSVRKTYDVNGKTFIPFNPGGLPDYLGFPTPVGTENRMIVDALPFRAYNKIYNEYYRDQNLSDELPIYNDVDGIVPVESVPSSTRPGIEILQLRNRAWKKDYFTSALPFAQRGPEIELPLEGTASIKYDDSSTGGSPLGIQTFQDQQEHFGISRMYDDNDNPITNARLSDMRTDSTGAIYHDDQTVHLGGKRPGDPDVYTALLTTDSLRGLIKGVDLSSASASTINELRKAMRTQEFLELRARGGSRYIEQLRTFFGVRSSDARLQRPEFLGGFKNDVMISDVLQTSETTSSSAQATPAGNGVGILQSPNISRYFEEHGFLIGIISVMPEPCYQQGLSRLFQKFDPLDYYWPQFQHIGEQEIKEGELFWTGNSANDDKTFGYAPRYAEYKYQPSTVHGDFKDSLSFWHMGRIFQNAPKLSEEFVNGGVDLASSRVFAIQDSDVDKIWVNMHHGLTLYRKMSKYGTPTF